MSPITRFIVATTVLAIGALVGRLVRSRIQPAEGGLLSHGLPAGLVLVSAPFCTRCSNLRARLDQIGIAVEVINAAANPALVADLGVTSAPTLLLLDERGALLQTEARDFSPSRLEALAVVAGLQAER